MCLDQIIYFLMVGRNAPPDMNLVAPTPGSVVTWPRIRKKGARIPDILEIEQILRRRRDPPSKDHARDIFAVNHRPGNTIIIIIIIIIPLGTCRHTHPAAYIAHKVFRTRRNLDPSIDSDIFHWRKRERCRSPITLRISNMRVGGTYTRASRSVWLISRRLSTSLEVRWEGNWRCEFDIRIG